MAAVATKRVRDCHGSHKGRGLPECESDPTRRIQLAVQRRVPFTFSDISGECEVETDCFRVDDGRERRLGARVRVPRELRDRYPYNGSAYGFLQELRSLILELGIVVFPDRSLPKASSGHSALPDGVLARRASAGGCVAIDRKPD
jgi:hypothetical protein